MYNYWYDEIENLITEATECLDEMALYEQCVNEIVRKKVIRGKRAVIKKFCKLATQKQVGGRCVARSSKERTKKSRAMRKAARKRKGKQKRITRKMKKSKAIGKRMGLHKRRR
tara:strand:- start:2898 stop:3236 length:339 start_codon:yes stop_codon:yes gene_type:complete